MSARRDYLTRAHIREVEEYERLAALTRQRSPRAVALLDWLNLASFNAGAGTPEWDDLGVACHWLMDLIDQGEDITVELDTVLRASVDADDDGDVSKVRKCRECGAVVHELGPASETVLCPTHGPRLEGDWDVADIASGEVWIPGEPDPPELCEEVPREC